MSFLREVFGRGEAKTADEHRSEAGFPGWGPGMVWTEFPTGRRWGRGDTDEAMRLSAVFACIRLLSEAIATLPLDVFKRVGPTRVAQSTPLVLQFAPPGPTRVEYLGQLMISLLTDGNAFVMVGRTPLGAPISLQVLDPQRVQVARNKQDRVAYFVDGIGEELGANEIMHIKGMSLPGRLRGLSPIGYAMETISVGLMAQRYGARFFENGSLPSAVIEAEQGMSDAAISRWRETWDARHAGSDNAGKVGLLTGGAKFKQVSIDPKQAQFVEVRQFQVPDIARIFGVPPHLIADASNSTSWGSGLAEQNLAFGQFSLRPWITRIEEAHSALIRPSASFVKLNLDALLRASLADRYAAYAVGISNGFLTVDEARATEDLPPHPGTATTEEASTS